MINSAFWKISVQNNNGDALCVDRLKFYGTPKFGQPTIPFVDCKLSPGDVWAESNKVKVLDHGTDSIRVGLTAYNNTPLQCQISTKTTLKALKVKICKDQDDGSNSGSESEFDVVIQNGNGESCTTRIKGKYSSSTPIYCLNFALKLFPRPETTN